VHHPGEAFGIVDPENAVELLDAGSAAATDVSRKGWACGASAGVSAATR
jgi:hypothetical protein